MPELPEVETVVRELRGFIQNKTLLKILPVWKRSYDNRSDLSLNKQKINSIFRQGKYIIIRLDLTFLVIHLRMTGQLLFYKSHTAEKHDPYTRVKIYFEDNSLLHFKDIRKFGRIYHVEAPEKLIAHVGIDALDPVMTNSYFSDMLEKSQMNIKAFLMNQKYISGLGNIYIDESLFRTRIHPSRKASSISKRKANELYINIRDVLLHAIENMGSTISDYRDMNGAEGKNQNFFNVYDQEGKPCIKCGTKIKKIRFAGRGTHFCPKCQRI